LDLIKFPAFLSPVLSEYVFTAPLAMPKVLLEELSGCRTATSAMRHTQNRRAHRIGALTDSPSLVVGTARALSVISASGNKRRRGSSSSDGAPTSKPEVVDLTRRSHGAKDAAERS
jgi:hypothetical protein